MNSLRLRLLAILLTLFLGVWLATSFFTFLQARHEVEELFDAHLAQTARLLAPLFQEEVSPEPRPTGFIVPESALGHGYQKKIAFQVWRGDRLIARSASAPAAPLAVTPGYADRQVQGDRWRVFFLQTETLSIHAGESYEIREELIGEILQQMAFPLFWAPPLLGLVLWVGVGRGLRPMAGLTRQITSRSPRDLSPVVSRDAPSEMAPLMEALNRLMGRLERALASERRFTANAAHELRTPLSALLLHAEVGLRAKTLQDKDQALEEVRDGVARSAHQAEQLLALARAESSAESPMEPVDMAQLAREGIDALRLWAQNNGVTVAIGALPSQKPVVQGGREELRAALRNLLENAVKFTPRQGRVEASLTIADGGVSMLVDDSGPGIPESERDAMFQRFHRGAETGAVTGSGLGLAIVAEIASRHGAMVELTESPLGGLRAAIKGLPQTSV